MKILNVNMSLDPIHGGGTAERTFQISRYLAKSGISCSVLTLNLGLDSEREKSLNDVNVIALPCLLNRFYIPKISLDFLKYVIAEHDVVHLMNHWTVINAFTYCACKKLNKPYVVCSAGALPIYGRSQKIKNVYNRLIGKKIIKNAAGHIAIGANEIDHYQSYGIEAKKVTLIPNGITEKDFQVTDPEDFRRKYGLANNSFIMFMGRLNSIKGPDLLLRAFYNIKDRLQNYHLVFVGPDGGMLRELNRMVADFGLKERIHFLGYLGGVDKSQAYHAAELLAIPSRQEAMSIVVLEAGISGTPVLLTDQCGFDEIATVGGGKVVPATIEGIQHGLVEILQDPDYVLDMGKKLREHVSKHFTWGIVVDKYLKLYHQILDAKK